MGARVGIGRLLTLPSPGEVQLTGLVLGLVLVVMTHFLHLGLLSVRGQYPPIP